MALAFALDVALRGVGLMSMCVCLCGCVCVRVRDSARLYDCACPCVIASLRSCERVSRGCVSVCAAHVACNHSTISRNLDITDRETCADVLLVCVVAYGRLRTERSRVPRHSRGTGTWYSAVHCAPGGLATNADNNTSEHQRRCAG